MHLSKGYLGTIVHFVAKGAIQLCIHPAYFMKFAYSHHVQNHLYKKNAINCKQNISYIRNHCNNTSKKKIKITKEDKGLIKGMKLME
jgi:hypothetical protein